MSRRELRCERRERECVQAQMQPVAAGCDDAMLNVVSREPNHFFINVKCWTTPKIGQRQRGQFGIDMSDVRDLACRVPIISSARSRAADLWLISDRLPVAPRAGCRPRLHVCTRASGLTTRCCNPRSHPACLHERWANQSRGYSRAFLGLSICLLAESSSVPVDGASGPAEIVLISCVIADDKHCHEPSGFFTSQRWEQQ